jgi:hypothetical protein
MPLNPPNPPPTFWLLLNAGGSVAPAPTAAIRILSETGTMSAGPPAPFGPNEATTV